MTSRPRLVRALVRRAKAVSVRTKIIGIILGLTIVLGASVIVIVRITMEEQLSAEFRGRGAAIASDLAGRVVEPVLFDDRLAVQELLLGTMTTYDDVVFSVVIGHSGEVVADTLGGGGIPVDVADSLPQLIDELPNDLIVATSWGEIHQFAAPIGDGTPGTVVLAVSRDRIGDTIARMTNQLLIVTIVIGLVGELGAGLLTWYLTRPIDDLMATTSQVRAGDLTARASPWADDEIGALASSFNEMVAALERGRAEVEAFEEARQALLAQLLTAQEEERKRISRQLHDSIGQSLGSLIVGATLLERSAEPDQAERAREMKRVASETLQQVRQLSHDLRPSVLDDLGLEAAIERYAEDFAVVHPDIGVDVHVDLAARLPAEVETTLYRVVQEAMTNAARHSGASALHILVSQHNGGVRAIVEDDGGGIDEKALHDAANAGLHGMRERAQIIGGGVEIETSEGGTTVYVEVPV